MCVITHIHPHTLTHVFRCSTISKQTSRTASLFFTPLSVNLCGIYLLRVLSELAEKNTRAMFFILYFLYSQNLKLKIHYIKKINIQIIFLKPP